VSVAVGWCDTAAHTPAPQSASAQAQSTAAVAAAAEPSQSAQPAAQPTNAAVAAAVAAADAARTGDQGGSGDGLSEEECCGGRLWINPSSNPPSPFCSLHPSQRLTPPNHCIALDPTLNQPKPGPWSETLVQCLVQSPSPYPWSKTLP